MQASSNTLTSVDGGPPSTAAYHMQMLQHRRRHFKQKSTNQVPRIRHTTLQHFHSQMMLLTQVVRLRQGRTHRSTCPSHRHRPLLSICELEEAQNAPNKKSNGMFETKQCLSNIYVVYNF